MIQITSAISPFRYYSAAIINGLFSLTPVIYCLYDKKILYPFVSSELFVLFSSLASIIVGKLYIEISLYIEAFHIDQIVDSRYPNAESYANEARQFRENSHVHYWYAYLLRKSDSNDEKKIADLVIGFIVERMIFWIAFMCALFIFSSLLLLIYFIQFKAYTIVLVILTTIIFEYNLFHRVIHLADSLSFLRYLIKNPNGYFIEPKKLQIEIVQR